MIPSIIDQAKRDALDPILQAEYKQLVDKDGDAISGMYMADIGEVSHGGGRYALENVHGLRTTLEDIRNQRNTLRDGADKFKGVDMALYARLTAKQKEIDEFDLSKDAGAKLRIEELSAAHKEKYDTDLGAERTLRETAERKYSVRACESEVMAAIAKHAPKSARLLKREVMDRIALFPSGDPNRDDVFVVGSDGKPKITNVAGQTGNMTVDELVGTVMRKDPELAGFYPGTGATGSGAAGSSTAGLNARGTAQDLSKLSPTEKYARASQRQAALGGAG